MLNNRSFLRTLTLASLFSWIPLLGQPARVQAGCGCDKPAPAPAMIIPNAAYPGMKVTLFDNQLQNGQTWNVTFHNGAHSISTTATVVTKRALTNPTGQTVQPQLVVSVPFGFPMGPTGIVAAKGGSSFSVSANAFTVIGSPITISEHAGNYSYNNYVTGIGADGTLYLTVGGLQNVCKPIAFNTTLKNYPLRFGSGDIVILNHQGFFVDALNEQSADHFSVKAAQNKKANTLNYFRHSFAKYCENHLPGGLKEVAAQDQDWHLDGTPHTDYSAIIFAIAGSFDNGSQPQPGSVTFNVQMTAKVANGNAGWAREQEEENVPGSSGPGSKKHK
jgi:hypothetical protein